MGKNLRSFTSLINFALFGVVRRPVECMSPHPKSDRSSELKFLMFLAKATPKCPQVPSLNLVMN